jgi:hypothetical protein
LVRTVDGREQVIQFDLAIGRRQDDTAFDHIFQFAYVARPRIEFQRFHRFVGQAGDALAVQGAELGYQCLDQRRYVERAFAQRWDVDRIRR